MTDDIKLQQFATLTREQVLNPGYGQIYYFFVGRDDVHNVIKQLIEQEKLGIIGNMFGFDDQELNDAILAKFADPHCQVQITLDKSQAGGVHEASILKADETNPNCSNSFATDFAIGESETHQISHTKSFVFLGQGIFFGGSTNWSSSGEGTGVSLKLGAVLPKGFKAQNNQLDVCSNLVNLIRVRKQLDDEHQTAKAQGQKTV